MQSFGYNSHSNLKNHEKKVLLIRPNANEDTFATTSKNMTSTSPPLGIMYISSYLKFHNIENFTY